MGSGNTYQPHPWLAGRTLGSEWSESKEWNCPVTRPELTENVGEKCNLFPVETCFAWDAKTLFEGQSTLAALLMSFAQFC